MCPYRSRRMALTNPRTCLRLEFAKGYFPALEEIASQHGFVLLPYNKISTYLRHFSAEKKRFNGSMKDHNFEIRGCEKSGELSIMARMVLLWLEYYSISGQEFKGEVQRNRRKKFTRYFMEGGYVYPTLDEIKDTINFPSDTNDLYFQNKMYKAINEIIPVSYRLTDESDKFVPIIDTAGSAIQSGKIKKKNLTQVKLSYAYRQTLDKLMVYPRYGLYAHNPRQDAIFFYLVSYLSYRFACNNTILNHLVKIKVKTLLEHIPVFRTVKDIHDNYNSRYKDLIMTPLFSAIKRLPDGNKTEIWHDDMLSVLGWDEYPDTKSFLKGHFLFNVSNYCEVIRQMVHDYPAKNRELRRLYGD